VLPIARSFFAPPCGLTACIHVYVQGRSLIPYDIAEKKHYEECAKLLRPDEQQPTSTETETNTTETAAEDETAEKDQQQDNSERKTEDREDDQNKDTDNKDEENQQYSSDAGSQKDAEDKGDDDDNDAKSSDENDDDKDKDAVDVRDDTENQEPNEETIETADYAADDSLLIVPVNVAAPSSDDKVENEQRQKKQDGSTNSPKKAEEATKTDGKGATEQKRKPKEVSEKEPEKTSKQQTSRKSRKDKPTPRNTGKTKSQPTSPSRSPDSRPYDSAPSPSRTAADDQSTTVKSNEQRRDRRCKNKNKNDATTSPNARSKGDHSTSKTGSGTAPPSQSAKKEPTPYSMQEQVRIFEMRRLTSRELEKTRRYQQQLGRAGAPMSGATDKQLTRMIADDYNEKAHRGYHIDSSQVNDLGSLETHLKGMTSACIDCIQRQVYLTVTVTLDNIFH